MSFAILNRCRGYGVKKLVLLAAAAPRFTQTPDFPYGMTQDAVDQMIEQIQTDRAQFSEDFSRKLLYSPHSEAIKDWFCDLSLSASSIGTIATGYALRDEDGCADLYSVHVPTGIFHGKQDQIVPFELGELQNQRIAGSQLFAFENSGHGIFYDELERFNQCFLQIPKKVKRNIKTGRSILVLFYNTNLHCIARYVSLYIINKQKRSVSQQGQGD
mgnify:CR=1 FL=1